MSLDLAHKLLNSIMSYEDPKANPVSLQIVQDTLTSDSHIYLKDTSVIAPESTNYNKLFSCHDNLPYHCVFAFESSLGLSTFFNMVADPARLGINLKEGEVKVKANIVWIKTLVHSIRKETSPSFFNELLNSVLIDLSIRFSEAVDCIIFQFSKHSSYSKKNIHFELKLDLDFKFKSVNFLLYTYNDSYQQNTLNKFKPENQLMAFHVLLAYYSNKDVHQRFDELIDVNYELNDDNLPVYHDLANMILI